MAIIQSMCTSFKRELLLGVHDFSTHTFRAALYTSAASLNASTTAYTSAGEISGAGYAAGGQVLVQTPPVTEGGTAFVDFADVSWPSATFIARGALIYNSSVAGNPAVIVLDFGADRVAVASTFSVQFPAPVAATAIVRIV
jgi:hypothetical protein